MIKKVKTTDGIAPWRIDSKTERKLAKKADNSWFWRKTYVNYYKKHDKEYFNKGLVFIDKYIESFRGTVSPEKREFYIIDMVYSLHRFGCMFDEYFMYNYENLNTKGRESFITDKMRWSYYAKMNTSKANAIFNDKESTYKYFGAFYKRELLAVSKESDRELFCEFAKKHDKFIVKPCNSSGGRGVYKVDLTETNIEDCFKEILEIEGGVVVEELIVQSEKMASIHPNSVNTLRLPTIRDNNGVHVFHPVLRVGKGGSVVDNAARGGIFASVDPDTGIVCTKATDEFGSFFVKHPDTGVIFPGFELPDWDGAIKLVNKLAYVIKENHYVGWDLAHTDAGWVMVEGNPRAQMIVGQVFFREGFREEVEGYIENMKFLLIDRPLTPEELREDYIEAMGLEWVLELEKKLGHPVR